MKQKIDKTEISQKGKSLRVGVGQSSNEDSFKAGREAILMFSCVGRKLVLGRRTQEEVSAVRKVLGEDVPLIGFYTYGEIGPIDKTDENLAVAKFHNETVVLWVVGRR